MIGVFDGFADAAMAMNLGEERRDLAASNLITIRVFILYVGGVLEERSGREESRARRRMKRDVEKDGL